MFSCCCHINTCFRVADMILTHVFTLLPFQSESSGAVSDISSSSSVSMESGTSIHSSLGPIGEIPEVLLKGVKVARFGEEGDERMGDEEELLLSYSTTEPAQEIVVRSFLM